MPLVAGLLGAAAVVIAALLGLVGVLWAASRNYKIGSRTAGTQETAAETARITQLVAENKDARLEVSAQWEANQKLRQSIELADAQHESECQAWAAKEKSLLAKIGGLLGENAKLAGKQGQEVADLTAKLDQVSAEAGVALRAQERAEGGLQQARRTISQFSPDSQISPGNHPEEHLDPQT